MFLGLRDQPLPPPLDEKYFYCGQLHDSDQIHLLEQRRRKAATMTVAKNNRRQRKAKTSAGGERAYRRMPDPNEVMAAYEEVGTVSGLAEHFGVPRHTVNHWARRLRGQGYEIGRNS